jgi:hypothetical protein
MAKIATIAPQDRAIAIFLEIPDIALSSLISLFAAPHHSNINIENVLGA